MSSSGPHRLFRFLFTVVVEAGLPGTAGAGVAAVGAGVDEAGQIVAGGKDPDGTSGGDLCFKLGSGAVRVPVEPALAFRNSSSFCR